MPRLRKNFFLLVFFALLMLSGCQHSSTDWLTDAGLKEYISSMTIDSLGGMTPKVDVERVRVDLVRVRITFQLEDSIHQDDWKVTIRPAFAPTFHWAPHLTPGKNNIIAQHVFRAPALIVADDHRMFSVVPDLDLIGKDGIVKWYMDMDASQDRLVLGVSKSYVPAHTIFAKRPGQIIPPPVFEFGFYILTGNDPASVGDPWRKSLALMWSKWGEPLAKQGEPVPGNLEPFVKHTYDWAFGSWKKNVWQEFSINGKKVGAPVFIVNYTQSPNYDGPVNEREFRSIWNQAWFSSLRSAQGVYRYAKRNHNDTLMTKAQLTKELALAFPQQDGLFPGLIAAPMEVIEVDGKKVNRSKGWKNFSFGNSNRNPTGTWGNAVDAPYHILDMSWTANLMLTWYEELEKDERLVQYATRYADKLITLQDSAGFFPAWLDTKTRKPIGVLDQSPESSMSATFLLKAHKITGKAAYKEAGMKAIDAVLREIVPAGRWEDFETYWSCSSLFDSLVGKKIARNDQYKQNTLSIYWTAEALLAAWQTTGDKKYLVAGERVLDELLMFQASWQPPYIAIHALGGFGVMNADGEWNDSRQSLFAELIIQYGKELQREEYVQRGIAALKASFVMMYCPENPATMAQWEKVYPFFGEQDYGFMIENYGHGGETNDQGLGIGEFTIYDWGNGAAAEGYNRIKDHFPDLL